MRVLVALSLPEANQTVEALSNRADSMRHRVTIGKARMEDVSAAILSCALAEAAIREAFGFDLSDAGGYTFAEAADWRTAALTGSYDPSTGESHDPLPDIPLALTPDPGDHFVWPGVRS